jgi:hypothetical protein
VAGRSIALLCLSLAAAAHAAPPKTSLAKGNAATSLLVAQPLKPIKSLKAFCKSVDINLQKGETPTCKRTTSKDGASAKLGAASAFLYEHGALGGERAVHLIMQMPTGQLYACQRIYAQWDPGAGGISVEYELMRLYTTGNTIALHTRTQRSDTDMGMNEEEYEIEETRTFCGMAQGTPRCLPTITAQSDGERSLIHPSDDPEPGLKHTSWKKDWALSITLTQTATGDALLIERARGRLPKTAQSRVGTHPLPW